MEDLDLLREALEALKAPALNTPELQSRIAARLAEDYAGAGSAGPRDPEAGGLDAAIPILPPR